MPIPSDVELNAIVQRVLGGAAVPGAPQSATLSQPQSGESTARKIALAADHGGYSMKEALKVDLEKQGFAVIDCGTSGEEPVDYPDFASRAARLVASGEAWRAIVIDGAGIGSCMAANKVRGVRAAMCVDHSTASNAREHNDANVLSLGAGRIGLALAKQIVATFLSVEFGGGRHAGRVEKIMKIEESYE